ncbi:winged helix-turn-helix domain-containing protein [Streptomyces shenzhenensis]|uniref:winged helix-turn-helix domain-containing protein n=1 Tax=Streptomyces shenzhenensis TaxID=943815 RepID=UPI0038076BCE
MATVIARRFQVRFSPVRTWRVLHRMGFTAQVPTCRAAERDQDAVATWTGRLGPAWEDGAGPGRVAVLRGRVGPGAPAARGTDLVPARPHVPRHRPGRGLGTCLTRRPGVPQAGRGHPARLPDAGAPRSQA